MRHVFNILILCLASLLAQAQLQYRVPVTDNWILSSRPSFTVHVENGGKKVEKAVIELAIATDKLQPVTTLRKDVRLAAGKQTDLILTADRYLPAGFYHATCTANSDTVRAFFFGINPTKIISAPDKQDDFDAFWAAAKAQLEAVDMNATLTELPTKSTAARKVYLVEMQSIPDGLSGEPVTIRGYYCEPQDGRRHPVIMHYKGYDYLTGGDKPYCPSGDSEPDYAEFFLSTRGQRINNRTAAEREPDGKGDFVNTYGDWFAFHFGDRDSWYYRGAFMDCVQAIRFMATRPTSDMSNLFAEGGSQGGAFSYAAAALSDYPFRAIAPAVAFLGDYPDYFDLVGWPAEVARRNQGSMSDREMFAFLSYFDTKNLATRIACAVIACSGLQDDICPPHTNIAPFNLVNNPDKIMLFNPEMKHATTEHWYREFMTFFAERIRPAEPELPAMPALPGQPDSAEL